MVGEKEQTLHTKLVEKTRSGRIRWNAHDVNTYFIDFGQNGGWRKPMEKYHITVTRCHGIPRETVVLNLNDEYLTSWTSDGFELFSLAETSCESRQKMLREVMEALERL